MAEKSSSWMWRGIVLGFITLIGVLLAWNFSEVAAIPKVYPTKIEVNQDQVKQDLRDTKQDTRIDKMQEAIVEGFRETQRIILDLHK